MRVDHLATQSGMFTWASFEPLAVMQEWWQLAGLPDAHAHQHLKDELVKSQESVESVVASQFVQPAITRLLHHSSKILSGIIVDPYVGLQVPRSDSGDQAGLILPISIPQSGQVDPLAVPQFDHNWSVADISNNYGVAKLTLYYHPKEEQALRKKQLVAELSEYCRYEKIDFALDLVLYTPAGEEFALDAFQADQLQAIQEMRSYAQMMLLQYPLDPLACATLTTELDIPWLVSSRGIRYDEYKETVRTALEGGAKGFCLHEIGWPQPELDVDALLTAIHSATQKHDRQALADMAKSWHDQFEKQLSTTIRDQMLELSRITQEFAA